MSNFSLACAAVATLFAATTLGACSASAQHANTVAERAGLTRAVLVGDGFSHVTYSRVEDGAPLLVYLDGDGRPWIHDGREVSADPTVRHPLALSLAASTTSGSVLYLGRPCYLGLAKLPECRPDQWTFERYSAAIVRSIAACINKFTAVRAIGDVILVGHSGGGTLAVLAAPYVRNLRAVITVAGNLDVKAWTAYHRYLPLNGSLDPADAGPFPNGIVEIHLTGGADSDIPPALIERYLAAHPRAQHRNYDRFDHNCCWRAAWPQLLPELLQVALSDEPRPLRP
jgi:pimeloyl-ACP methyl ester carboxylesterase